MKIYGNELYHYGILGQKWGIRRYQNEDGSLTEEGRLRYKVDSKGKLQKLSRSEKVSVKKQIAMEKDKAKPLKERNIAWMTDEELQQYSNRMNAERNAYSVRADIARYNQPKESFFVRTGKKLLNEAVVPAAVNLGKQYLEKVGREAINNINKQEESEIQKLKKENDLWTTKAKIAENKVKYENLSKKLDN